MTREAVDHWNNWNARFRKPENLDEVSFDQRREVLAWLERRHIVNADILDVGCGTGWLCEYLLPFGQVTGTDLSDLCLIEAQQRWPLVRFMAGDFMELEFSSNHYDVVVSLEVITCVEDQAAFVAKIARVLKVGGLFILATPNPNYVGRWFDVVPVAPGQVRKWLGERQLRTLLSSMFDVLELKVITPRATNRTPWFVSHRIQRLLGRDFSRCLEVCGFGWTIMGLARKR